MSVKKGACVEINVRNRNFKCLEVNKRGDNRDIQMIHCVANANWVTYQSNYGPISQDKKWYHGNVKEFYRQLGIAIAQGYIDNGDVWPHDITTIIHGHEYFYTII